MVARKPVHQGEHEVSRKTIAQGRPGCLRRTCMLVCVVFCANCTRDRGCGVHPVFPAPSSLDEGKASSKPRAISAARMRTHTSQSVERGIGMSHRHCERSEAIHLAAQRKN